MRPDPSPAAASTPPTFSPGAALDELVSSLRAARGDEITLLLRASTQRLEQDPAYRAALRHDIHILLGHARATHAYTEAGILSDEAITEGVLRIIGERVAPAPFTDTVLEHVLRKFFRRADRRWLSRVQADDVAPWLDALGVELDREPRAAELASALVILATRVAGAGMDPRLTERMPLLEEWTSPFLELSRVVDAFAAEVVGRGSLHQREEATAVVGRCRDQVWKLREAMKYLGTTLRLSSALLRMLQQLDRLQLLIDCASPAHRTRALARLGLELAREGRRARPVSRFVRQKLDLVAYLVVGHAAQKGAKYAVNTRSEYRSFWFKSLLGGLIVALFASLKLHLGHEGMAPVPQALLYGANYAVCFVLIFLFGATLATKQPALTASRLADAVAAGPHESPTFAERVRAIWRSQFISFLGNIFGAGLFAVVVAYAFERYVGRSLIAADEAQKLAGKLHPWESGTLAYAAVAGVMLSAAGFLAGFVDNAMVFHQVSGRVRSGGGIFWLVPGRWLREQLARRIEANAGAVVGNVTLGFMLGSAGAIGAILGIPFDIRHIAFGSSHAVLAVWQDPRLATFGDIALLVLSVSGIGLVNFLVSFSLTLSVAITARRLEGTAWRTQLTSLWRLMRTRPVSFLLPRS